MKVLASSLPFRVARHVAQGARRIVAWTVTSAASLVKIVFYASTPTIPST